MHLRLRLFCLLFVFAPVLGAQPEALPAFPDDFTGKWGGTLEIYNAKGFAQSVPMELHILPVNDSTYTYTIIYGKDKEAGKRDYLITRGPDGPHHWVCDEQNTILLDGYYLGNVYQSVFTVMGTYLVSNVEHRGDHLLYSIQSGSEKAVRTTGNQPHEGEEIPEVKSFKSAGYQRAKLKLIVD
ncbi:hypothetical protein FUA23_00305 [Neolewinella aurantiaca]|uniref:Uncharacterized protein n=1 Tax=Neolewinella aurantiaca TaxID=2602767 RepID=A0A5C7FK12_9BACT|nr:hypothetical protein [Neolewinella aurantiaca]TXF91659.1 hypothetical protein FUA23_00305 [Neolewinella aurantiaca]